jgi:hypothetical protein
MDSSWLEHQGPVEITLKLEGRELLKAARVGCDYIRKDDYEAARRALKELSEDIKVELLVKIALYEAMLESFDRRFPARYPDDFADDELLNVIPFSVIRVKRPRQPKEPAL